MSHVSCAVSHVQSANSQVQCVVFIVYIHIFLDGYCSTVQSLLDWFEVDLRFTELLFIQIDLCVMCVYWAYPYLCDTSCLLRKFMCAMSHVFICAMSRVDYAILCVR